MGKKRARNISDSDITQIVSILDGWVGPLNWKALIDAIAHRHHTFYTRQALYMHERIRNAFAVRKRLLKEEPHSKRHRNSELEKLEEIKIRLEAERARLRSENDNFLLQFARWAKNAHDHGMTEEQLNAPLPPVDRRKTKLRQP